MTQRVKRGGAHAPNAASAEEAKKSIIASFGALGVAIEKQKELNAILGSKEVKDTYAVLAGMKKENKDILPHGDTSILPYGRVVGSDDEYVHMVPLFKEEWRFQPGESKTYRQISHCSDFGGVIPDGAIGIARIRGQLRLAHYKLFLRDNTCQGTIDESVDPTILKQVGENPKLIGTALKKLLDNETSAIINGHTKLTNPDEVMALLTKKGLLEKPK